MESQNTIKRALYIEPFLSVPKHEKLILLGFYLKMKPLEVLSNLDLELPDFVFQDYFQALKKLQNGFPVQYITQSQGFYELDFFVNPDVLIPRPETEILVQSALDLNLPSNFNALDIGTGSGCIPISIAKKYPESKWTALDISSKALDVAIKNAKLNKVSNINFFESDLIDSINQKYFDLITANLPYIGTEKYSGVSTSAKRYEPNSALFSGEDGLDLYRKLFKDLRSKQIKFDYLLLEHADNQEQLLEKLIKESFPEKKIQFICDLNKINRIILIF